MYHQESGFHDKIFDFIMKSYEIERFHDKIFDFIMKTHILCAFIMKKSKIFS